MGFSKDDKTWDKLFITRPGFLFLIKIFQISRDFLAHDLRKLENNFEATLCSTAPTKTKSDFHAFREKLEIFIIEFST